MHKVYNLLEGLIRFRIIIAMRGPDFRTTNVSENSLDQPIQATIPWMEHE